MVKTIASLFSFNGRARRREYWLVNIAVALVMTCAFLALVHFAGLPADQGMEKLLESMDSVPADMMALFGLAVFVCLLLIVPVSVRRFHDRNMSGMWLVWFLLLGMIPFIGMAAWLAQNVILGFFEGTIGENRFGPDPKAEQHKSLMPRPAPETLPDQPRGLDCGTLEERMERLEDLARRGIVTEAEYRLKREEFEKEAASRQDSPKTGDDDGSSQTKSVLL